MGALVFAPRALGRELSELEKQYSRRRNPAKTPPELKEIFEEVSQWASPDMKWLTENAKMDKPVKGEKWVVRGVSFMPARDAQKFFRGPGGKLDRARLKQFNITESQLKQMGQMCPGATKGCMAVCLSTAGQMGLPASAKAQLKRQIVFKQNREAFMTILVSGIARLYRSAKRKGARLGIRLNVTSDLDWENIPVQVDPWLSKWLASYGVKTKPGKYPNIMKVFKKVQFYDYTKVVKRMADFLDGRLPRNYHLTWSLAETPINRRMALEVLLSRKSTVSVPFDIVTGKTRKGEDVWAKYARAPLPKTLTIVEDGIPYTFKVVDADKHDLRPRDPKGTISGLRFKVPKPRGRRGMKVSEKIRSAGKFVVKAGKDRHPVIHVRGR